MRSTRANTAIADPYGRFGVARNRVSRSGMHFSRFLSFLFGIPCARAVGFVPLAPVRFAHIRAFTVASRRAGSIFARYWSFVAIRSRTFLG